MTQLEQDLVIIAAIGCLLEEEGMDIKEIISDYDDEKINELAMSMNLFKDDNDVERRISELANECYHRVKENFK